MQSIVGERNDGLQQSQQDGGRSTDNHYPSHNGSVATTIMKLAKRHGGIACLCVDGKCAGAAVDVYHAIPIRIMRAGDMQ